VARFFKLLVVVPIAILILAFAIANRQMISVSFDPFSDPSRSTAVVTAPLFILMFLTLILGTLLGGIATWITQGTNRRRARLAEDEAEHWRAEVRRLRDQPPLVADSRMLAQTGR
jgi:heme/copper-type cytochrome/quinol oxidase subunit 1